MIMKTYRPILSSFVYNLSSLLARFLHILARKQGRAIVSFHFETRQSLKPLKNLTANEKQRP